MAYVTREQVAEALFALLTSSSPGVFVTTSRKFQMWSSVSKTQQPALFMREPTEKHINDAGPEPAIRVWHYEAYIYINTPLTAEVTPSSLLNPLIDAIDPAAGGVLLPNLLTGHQTLGGLVYDCRLDGEILKEAGDLTGQGVAMIPIKVVVP
jgi:hypothetical protein